MKKLLCVILTLTLILFPLLSLAESPGDEDLASPGDQAETGEFDPSPGGTHTITAVYTCLYHIMPSLFSAR